MRRYRTEIDNVRAHLRSLWVVIGLQFVVILVLWFGWSQAPKQLTVHVPRSALRGDALGRRSAGGQCVCLCLYIFQQLNRWPDDGARTTARPSSASSPYVTPRYRTELMADLEQKAVRVKLAYRVRGVHEIAGHGYEERRVDVLAPGVWVVWLDLDLFESVKGMTVKKTAIRYPLRVVSLAVDPEANPWGWRWTALRVTGRAGWKNQELGVDAGQEQ